MNTSLSPSLDKNEFTWKKSYYWAGIYQLLLLFITITVIYYITGEFDLEQFRARFMAWDGTNYLFIANHGYVTDEYAEARMIVFFPLYPFLIHYLSPHAGLDCGSFCYNTLLIFRTCNLFEISQRVWSLTNQDSQNLFTCSM